MQDLFGREISYLRLSVTENCNLRCLYCMPGDRVDGSTEQVQLCQPKCQEKLTGAEEMLSPEEMLQAVKAAVSLGVKKVRITGGEPLLRKDIVSLCQQISQIDGVEELCMTTNGVLLPELAIGLHNAGVNRINISLDTLDSKKYEKITRGGNLELALKGLEAALTAGFAKVKINTVLIGGFNENEIPALADLTKKYPVDVRFIELMPMENSGHFDEKAFVSNKIVLGKLPELEQAEGKHSVAKMYRLPGGKGQIGLISPITESFCKTCDRLRITADGKVKSCLHAPMEYDIRGKDKEAMSQIMTQAILEKPACHGNLHFPQVSGANRNMNRIGG